MFRRQLNRARVLVEIEPAGPILIRSGKSSLDPTRPDLEWVRTQAAVGPTIYIPGSSLKGVLRAQAERILRTVEMRCCDPLDLKNEKCHRKAGDKLAEDADRAKEYARLCAACRTFGSTRVAGRLAIADAFPWRPGASLDDMRRGAEAANATEQRTGVAIDRQTGATRHGVLYDLEVATAGVFTAEISLRNFQLWQLGLLGYVLHDLDQGHARVGSGKSRGLGRVRARVYDVLVQAVRRGDPGRLRGAGELGAEAAYALASGDAVDPPPELAANGEDAVYDTWRAEGPDAARALFSACQGAPWARAREQLR